MLLAKFQHTATRRWLPHGKVGLVNKLEWFQHTATRRWLPLDYAKSSKNLQVSTHSHPKVAAIEFIKELPTDDSFNTQPPEGGCVPMYHVVKVLAWFQHTATRRWLPSGKTHRYRLDVCFNTQPPEGGCLSKNPGPCAGCVSTHSHPKVAAFFR